MTDPDPSAIFYDGRSSRRHVVALSFEDGLKINEAGVPLAHWAWRDLRPIESKGDVLRLTATTALDGARLDVFDTQMKQEIVTRCDLLSRPPQPQRRQGLQLAILSLAAFASIGALLWFGIPYAAGRIAPLVPVSWEQRLGSAAEGQVRTLFPGKACSHAAGRAALDKLTGALTADAVLPMPATFAVLASPIANAFALPGGKIFLFQGLLEKAQSPDEIAGVLAHELGHLAHRDHLRRLIANGGTAYIVGLLFGDVTGAGALLLATRTLLGAAYSRDAEAAADSYAADVMNGLGRSTKSMGELLVRIEGTNADDRFGLLRDHPAALIA